MAHHYFIPYFNPLIVPTIKNKDRGLTPPDSAVYEDHTVNNGEQVIASEEKLKGMMMEMNQTLNILSGSISPDSSTNKVIVLLQVSVYQCNIDY